MSSPDERAEALLQTMLTDKQWHDWCFLGFFECVGSRGTRYRIYRGAGWVRNVVQLRKDGSSVARMCAHPHMFDPITRHRLPQADLVLGQFLTLVSDEKEFLRKANVVGSSWRITNPVWWMTMSDVVLLIMLCAVTILGVLALIIG